MTTPPLEIVVRRVHLGLLWGASLFVPASKRREWSEEWRTELWYVLRECFPKTRVDPKSVKLATAFCLGAYQDAVWLRRRAWRKQQPLARVRGSAYVCLLLLIGTLFFTWGIAHISTRVAAGISSIQVYPWRMSDTGASPCDCPFDLVVGQRSLHSTQLFFDGFSHYRITQDTVWAEDVPRTKWTVAHARSDFFDVLHLPVRKMDGFIGLPDRLTQAVLSQDTWKRDFGGKPNLAGARLHVGSFDAVIAGVAFAGTTGLPGRANVWLLGSDPEGGNMHSGFVVGHLSPAGYFDDGRWGLSVGGILLAFLVSPFLSRPSIGEYGNGSQKPSLASRSRFWAFLFAKITMLTAIVYYASLDLGCLLAQPFSPSSAYVQVTSSVALCLLGLGWAFRDQQHRCPVCVRQMAHPVEVGQPSRTFLDWNGTELVCERGHTLLHIPEAPTSWFSSQRWVCLDSSWQFLFARPGETSTLL
jgi:hypothetical protein